MFTFTLSFSESKHNTLCNGVFPSFRYSTNDSKPRYTEEVAEKYRLQNAELSRVLNEQLTQVGAVVDDEIINSETHGKIPIMITGASKV